MIGKTTLGKAALGLSIIAVLSKIFGFSEKLIVAHYFGTGAQADVYYTVIGIVLSLAFLVKELVYPSIMPVFAQALKASFIISSALFKKTFLWFMVLVSALVLMMVFFSDYVAAILAPGFSDENKLLTSSLLQYFAPGVLFLCLATLTYAVLNCRRFFLKAAITEASFKFMAAGGLILLAPVCGIYAPAIAVGVGAAIILVVQFLFIPEGRYLLTQHTYKPTREINKVVVLMSPLVVGVVFSHISGLVDTMLASTLPTGHLSFLGYSKKLIDAILLVGPITLVTVVYSQLSHLNAEEKREEFRILFIKSIRLILFISIPLAVGLVMLRRPIIAALFERGQFGTASTAGTSQALLIYAAGFVTFSLESMIVYSFYALSDTRSPVRIGIFGVVLDIVLAVTLVRPFGFAAIAGAYVLSKTVKVVILFVMMNKRIPCFHNGLLVRYVLKISISCFASACCLYLVRGYQPGGTFFNTVIYGLGAPAAGFTGVFLMCCRLMKIEELNRLQVVLLRKTGLRFESTGDMS